MDLEADLRHILLTELVDYTAHPDELARLGTRDLLGVYGNWASRFPAVRPRTVHCSKELEEFLRTPTEDAVGALHVLTELEAGVDIEFRLSKDVDVAWVPPSAPRRQRLKRLDRYLAAWGIHHLHLGSSAPDTGRARSSNLLYAVFDSDQVFALAVRPHGAWHDDELLHIAADNWPDGGPLRTSRFVIGLEQEVDAAERSALFRANVAVPLTRNGRVYFSRDHVSLAGTSLNAEQWANQTYYELQGAINILKRQPGEIAAAFSEQPLGQRDQQPSWEVIVQDQRFVVIETTTGAIWDLADIAARPT